MAGTRKKVTDIRSTNWRGRGWRFPLQPDASGTLVYVEGEQNIEQSIRIILLTQLGERVMRPDFGCKAGQRVFAPGSVQNLRLLEVSVREALRDWEPRIEVDDVRAEAELESENRVKVEIFYRLRGTNTRQNLVFPYYLGTVTRP
jgi:phage baseplate assembly protein W